MNINAIGFLNKKLQLKVFRSADNQSCTITILTETGWEEEISLTKKSALQLIHQLTGAWFAMQEGG